MASPTRTRPASRFLRNSSEKEPHDLRDEKTHSQIDVLLRAGHRVTFTPDTLTQAQGEGYDNYAYCIGGSTR